MSDAAAQAAQAIEQVTAGRSLKFHSQDHSQGILTLNRQWSRPLGRQIRYLERRGLIAKMLKHPARKGRLPIVGLAGFGAVPAIGGVAA